MRSTFNTPLLVEIQVQKQTKIQVQVRHLWGRHWTHSFSWKPSSSSVLNFFPQPRHTFVCERKSWEFVSRLRCCFNAMYSKDLVGEGMSCKTFFVLAILRKENWVLSTSKVPELLSELVFGRQAMMGQTWPHWKHSGPEWPCWDRTWLTWCRICVCSLF